MNSDKGEGASDV